MTEDSSALPWSINRDDYELQEVIGESWRRGGGRRRAGRRVTRRNVGSRGSSGSAGLSDIRGRSSGPGVGRARGEARGLCSSCKVWRGF